MASSMCEPTAIIAGVGLAISVGSEFMRHSAESNKALQNKAGAQRANALSQQAITLRQIQEERAGSQTIIQADRQARAADALARVSAGQAGVAGASVDMILADIERERLEFGVATQRQTKDTLGQLERERMGVKSAMLDRINGVSGPSGFATGLRIGGHAVDYAGDYIGRLPKKSAGGGG